MVLSSACTRLRWIHYSFYEIVWLGCSNCLSTVYRLKAKLWNSQILICCSLYWVGYSRFFPLSLCKKILAHKIWSDAQSQSLFGCFCTCDWLYWGRDIDFCIDTMRSSHHISSHGGVQCDYCREKQLSGEYNVILMKVIYYCTVLPPFQNKKTVEPWGSVFPYERLQLLLYTLLILL
jgi:hypothetical protein